MFREVTMVEVKEVLRLWRAGLPRKRMAAQVGLDPETVRRYLAAATAAGVRPHGEGHRRRGARHASRAPSGGRAPARRRLGAPARRSARPSSGGSATGCG